MIPESNCDESSNCCCGFLICHGFVAPINCACASVVVADVVVADVLLLVLAVEADVVEPIGIGVLFFFIKLNFIFSIFILKITFQLNK